jgi:hypothetical protein
MPRLYFPELLRAVYHEASRLIEQRQIPTEMIPASATLFRSFDRHHASINSQGVFPRQSANAALLVRDQFVDQNRYSGKSMASDIPAWGGLYCSLQGQAIVNETMHYARAHQAVPRHSQTGFPDAGAALQNKCIVRIRLMGPALAADISVHNPGTGLFLDALDRSPAVQGALRAAGRQSVAQQIFDSEDCSAARGIGLAVANTSWLTALKATTVRPSDRAPEEMGDNIVFFGRDGQQVPNLWIDEAYLFPAQGAPVICPVEFAASM